MVLKLSLICMPIYPPVMVTTNNQHIIKQEGNGLIDWHAIRAKALLAASEATT